MQNAESLSQDQIQEFLRSSEPIEFGGTGREARNGWVERVNDMADRPARGLADGEEFVIGKHGLQWIYAPHVPHGWDCGVLFDKTTGTLLCGDLFTQGGMDSRPLRNPRFSDPAKRSASLSITLPTPPARPRSSNVWRP